MGHQVTLCLQQEGTPHRQDGPLRIYAIGTRRKRSIITRVLRRIYYLKEFLRIFRKEKPDIIHIQTFGGPFSFYAALSARLLGIPSIVKYTAEHSFEQLHEKNTRSSAEVKSNLVWNLKKHLLLCQDRLMLRVAQSVWVTTPLYRSLLLKKYHFPSARIFVLSNFIKLERFGKAEVKCALHEPFRILCVSRLRPWKGIETIIRTAAELKTLPAFWKLIGDGHDAYVANLKAMAVKLGVDEIVEFCGPISPESIPGELENGSVLLQLSHREPFGISILEAMASGLPVVATDIDGIRYVTENGKYAMLVNPDDVKAVAKHLRKLLEDHSLWQHYADLGIKRAKAFTLDSKIPILVDQYQRLSENNKA